MTGSQRECTGEACPRLLAAARAVLDRTGALDSPEETHAWRELVEAVQEAEGRRMRSDVERAVVKVWRLMNGVGEPLPEVRKAVMAAIAAGVAFDDAPRTGEAQLAARVVDAARVVLAMVGATHEHIEQPKWRELALAVREYDRRRESPPTGTLCDRLMPDGTRCTSLYGHGHDADPYPGLDSEAQDSDRAAPTPGEECPDWPGHPHDWEETGRCTRCPAQRAALSSSSAPCGRFHVNADEWDALLAVYRAAYVMCDAAGDIAERFGQWGDLAAAVKAAGQFTRPATGEKP